MSARFESRRSAVAAAALVSAALLLAPSALARDHDRGQGRGHELGHGSHRAVVVAPAPFVVPAPPLVARRATVVVPPSDISTVRIPIYRPYLVGDAYYAPHRHVHVVYRFPVQTAYGVVYRPHAYCRGHLFLPPGPAPDVVGPPSYGEGGVSGFVDLGGPNFRIAVGF